MPIFMVERNYAEQLELDDSGVRAVNEINDLEEVAWLVSFLSADRRKSYCLYEAESADAIRRAAERAGLPAGAVVEIADRVLPDGSLNPVIA